jgi:hypothetical protein
MARQPKSVFVKRLHDQRRAAGRCINEPNKGAKHGMVHRAGRCFDCWSAKLQANKDALAKARGWRWRGGPKLTRRRAA